MAPDAADEDGLAVVHLAAMHDAMGLLWFLVLTRGVDPSSKTLHGDTPALHLALDNGQEGAAAFLMDEARGCDVGAVGMNGWTPLMAAAGRGMVGVVRTLVEKGADVHAMDTGGRTALGYARKSKQEESAAWLLEEAGASWRATHSFVDGKRATMQEVAAAYDCPRVVKSVLRRMRAEGDGTTEDTAAAAAAAAVKGVLKAMERAAGHAVFNGSLAALKALVEEG